MGIRSKWLRIGLALGALASAAGCASLDEDPSGTFTVDLGGRVAVLVVDNSGGPEEFDPDGHIREGARFLLSCFGDADNVGIVTVRFPVEAILEITHLGEEGNRDRGAEALEAMKVGGDAEYYEALEKAREILDLFSAERDSIVVFLTGGHKRPAGNPQEIRDLMDVYASRGWRFFPVVLTPAPDLMGVLEYGAAMTQGAVFKIERPADILTSLVTVAGKMNDLWIRRSLVNAPVYENAERLVVAVTAGDEDWELERVTRDDAVVPFEGGSDRARVETSPAFQAVTFPAPEPGVWSGTMGESCPFGAVLVRPPFDCYLDPNACVKGSVLEGDEVAFQIVVEGEVEALAAWAPKGRSEVTLVSETTGKAVESFPLDRTFIPPSVRFSGSTRLFTSRPGEPEIFTARVTLYFGEGDQAWAREEFLSFEVKPAAVRAFRIEPPEVDLGVRWSDEKDISRTVEIIARVEEPVDVRAVDVAGGITVEPASVSASLGSRGSMRVALGEATRLEGSEGTLTFKVEGASPSEEGPSFERVVKVNYKLVKFVGPSKIELGPMEPGSEKRITTASWAVGNGTPFRIECGTLEGPGLIVPTLDASEGASVVVVSVPENAALGRYEGRIVLTAKERGLARRFIPLSLDVVARGGAAEAGAGEPVLVVDPPEIEMTSDVTGWVKTSFRVAVPEDGPPVTIHDVRTSSLRGKSAFETVSGQFDVRVSPAPGWDGKDLGRGMKSAFLVEVYFSSDLLDDEYEGKAVILYRVAGNEKLFEAPVDLRFTLKRSK